MSFWGTRRLQPMIRSLFAGAVALITSAAAPAVVAQERTISLHNIHTKETVSVVYKRDGKYVAGGLAQVDHVMRDWRRNEQTKMDPELVDLLWEMHNELGSKEPIHIISGFRSRSTNDQLRRTVGGQASESRHILGKAADVHFPDVPIKTLRYSALVREKGGVGYYPTSAMPFVHVDTDRVRSWPRLPRHELALLFPSGSTKHAAADGPAITKQDVHVAQVKHRDLAVQMAQFHEDRRANARGRRPVPLRGQEAPTVVADAGREGRKNQTPASAPRPASLIAPNAAERASLDALIAQSSAPAEPVLVAGPAPVRRPAAALASLTGPALPSFGPGQRPAESATVAALHPGAGPNANPGAVSTGGVWVPAPEWDEEHPEELSYRPFSILPLIHATFDAPLMSELVPHDVAKTLDYIDQPASAVLLRFRPGGPIGRTSTSQQFTGSAVGLAKLDAAKAPPPSAATTAPGKAVKTSQK
jgi:uncharacterized protein YcbK (DUF882 family)